MPTLADEQLTPKSTLIVEWYQEQLGRMPDGKRTGKEVRGEIVKAFMRASVDVRQHHALADEIEKLVWAETKRLWDGLSASFAFAVQEQVVPRVDMSVDE